MKDAKQYLFSAGFSAINPKRSCTDPSAIWIQQYGYALNLCLQSLMSTLPLTVL